MTKSFRALRDRVRLTASVRTAADMLYAMKLDENQYVFARYRYDFIDKFSTALGRIASCM